MSDPAGVPGPGAPGEARFVHIVDDVPELREGDAPVLIHALDGFLDAGNAGAIAVRHLLAGDAGRVVASFDIDAFYDYRARRPPLTFAEDHYEGYEAPRLVVRLLRDLLGTPYLLLHGPEPDTYWEAFAAAVRAVVEHFGVRLTVALGSVPMAVPHTRPVMLTNHASTTDLLVQPNVWKGQIRVPASAQAVLELRLGEWGHPAMGFVAHIPHYVAQVDYPAAAGRLLESVEIVTGLEWDLEPLEVAGQARLAEIAEQIEGSAEVRDVVLGLEQQYDSFHHPDQDATLPLAEERNLPTGEELGAEFERFLAGLDSPEE
ncbi:proteasome assembly chaperone family protein [Nocardioides mesophilus]|uniref:PAC2 family protein n=1 Tax=Nocardioides mesophilus TaxID=433659 RepID=A0A7G9RBF7_9ACTN|nr:PAC2 family protein [Nocardioides mesophilus]QNN52932.1 PAC2 family protein [Nocardioides mesophilus]